jgi:AcrR family transcriptional regulator
VKKKLPSKKVKEDVVDSLKRKKKIRRSTSGPGLTPTKSVKDRGPQRHWMKNSYTSKGEAARIAILSAASELFADRGFGDISIGEIAKRASVNRAMIAYYFRSKAGLYDAILEEAVSGMVRELGVGRSRPQSVRTLVESIGRVYAGRPHLAGMIARQMIDPSHILSSKATGVLGQFSGITKQILASANLRWSTKNHDSQVIHLIIVGAIIYFLLTRPYRERVWNQTAWKLSRPGYDDFIETLATIMSSALEKP